jgi:hypothetical protein
MTDYGKTEAEQLIVTAVRKYAEAWLTLEEIYDRPLGSR